MRHKDMLQVEVKLHTLLTSVIAIYAAEVHSRAITKRKIRASRGYRSPASLLAGVKDTC
jgi:hypothetical protein